MQTKLIILCATLFFVQFKSVAQDSTKPRTRIDSFSLASGTFNERQFIHVGNISGIEVQIITVTNLISNERVAGLHFEAVTSMWGVMRTGTANLDADEIDGLIRSFKYIKSNVINNKTNDYTEYNYTSKGYFEAGCFSQKKQGGWKLYIQLDKFNDQSIISLSIDNIDDLIKFLEDAKNKIDSL